MFKHEARLLVSVRFDKSGCPLRLTAFPAHEVSTNVGPRSPGDMISSSNTQSEQVLPCASVWAPLETGVTAGPYSAAQEPLAVHTVLGPVIRQLGESAGDTGGGKI